MIRFFKEVSNYLKRKRKTLLVLIVRAFVLYHFFASLSEYYSALKINKKYQKEALYLKARLLTVKARQVFIKTEEGAKLILNKRLEQLRD